VGLIDFFTAEYAEYAEKAEGVKRFTLSGFGYWTCNVRSRRAGTASPYQFLNCNLHSDSFRFSGAGQTEGVEGISTWSLLFLRGVRVPVYRESNCQHSSATQRLTPEATLFGLSVRLSGTTISYAELKASRFVMLT
jgi:hypothetical protein